jgi:hypothetical protein
LIDGQKIAMQKLNNQKPGKFMEVTYVVPLDMTLGKEKVTIRFQAHEGSMAGGIFGLRVVKHKK